MTKKTPTCRRCGECCRKGGPALHLQDLEMITESGTIPLEKLATIRAGERVFDQPKGQATSLDDEIIKIKNIPGALACAFFDLTIEGCAIYDKRPLECRAMYCEDISGLEEIYDKDRLTRSHLLPEDHPVWELIRDHEEKCPAGTIMDMAEEAASTGRFPDDAFLARALRYDGDVRELTMNRAGLPREIMDFIFGRPLAVIIRPFGVTIEERDGVFTVVMKEKDS